MLGVISGRSANADHIRRNALPHDWQPTDAHDDRAQVTKAREAAEALFRPNKVERTEAPTSASVATSPTEHPAPRVPRIIPMPSTTPVIEGTVAPSTDPTPKSRREVIRRRAEVPASQHDRVRALAGYGMTVDEVAELYGVQVGAIERIVGKD
jgi:hypothetical protein